MRFNKRNELHRVRTRQWSWNWYAGGDEEPLHRGHLIERDSQLNGENHPKTALSDTHRLLANLPGNQHITRRNALLVPTFAVAQAAH
ncbi:hypothetical protein DMB90_07575 [Raoultella planticola]|uniref:Uncharacterized protein n=1 Tax=Raoultella planticola TaxID=575 RepID=A0A5P6A9E5_RAOPL|nr:hypothetical protein DMB90_07575 [Raoultella planticola]